MEAGATLVVHDGDGAVVFALAKLELWMSGTRAGHLGVVAKGLMRAEAKLPSSGFFRFGERANIGVGCEQSLQCASVDRFVQAFRGDEIFVSEFWMASVVFWHDDEQGLEVEWVRDDVDLRIRQNARLGPPSAPPW